MVYVGTDDMSQVMLGAGTIIFCLHRQCAHRSFKALDHGLTSVSCRCGQPRLPPSLSASNINGSAERLTSSQVRPQVRVPFRGEDCKLASIQDVHSVMNALPGSAFANCANFGSNT